MSVVQLLVVMELPFCLLLSRFILGGRLHAREWSAIAPMTLGIVVLVLTLAPRGGSPGSLNLIGWLIGLVVTVAAIAASSWRAGGPRRRPGPRWPASALG